MTGRGKLICSACSAPPQQVQPPRPARPGDVNFHPAPESPPCWDEELRTAQSALASEPDRAWLLWCRAHCTTKAPATAEPSVPAMRSTTVSV